MGLLNSVMKVAKVGMARRMLRGGLGGKFGTVLLVAYLGKKAYDMVKTKKQMRFTY